jgi:sarcosine oxidase subunit gamma
MVDTRLSPLAGFAQLFAGVTGPLHIQEVAFRIQLNVRSALDETTPTERVLGTALPLVPNTLTSAGDRQVMWLGPDEWLVVAAGTETGLLGELSQAASVTDVSAARTIIRIGGDRARDLLAHGCALDLHPDRFPIGSCAQSRLALANVIIARPDPTTFWIFARASYASYLATWLLDAAVEYLDAPATVS